MKKKIPPRVVKAVIPEERSARSKKGNKIKECTPSRRARADPLRDEGKISPLFQIQKELRKITRYNFTPTFFIIGAAVIFAA